MWKTNIVQLLVQQSCIILINLPQKSQCVCCSIKTKYWQICCFICTAIKFLPFKYNDNEIYRAHWNIWHTNIVSGNACRPKWHCGWIKTKVNLKECRILDIVKNKLERRKRNQLIYKNYNTYIFIITNDFS